MRIIIKAIVKIVALLFTLNVLNVFINNVLASSLNSYYLMKNHPEDVSFELWGYIAIGLILLIIAALLIYFGWWKTDKIVKLLVGNQDDSQLVINTSSTDLYKVIIKVFGIWLIIDSIPVIMGLLSHYVFYSNYYPDYIGLGPDFLANALKQGVTALLMLLIGIILLLTNTIISRGIVRLWSTGSIKEEKEVDK